MKEKNIQDRAIQFLYETLPGRCVLKILVHPCISKMVGSFMDTRCSTFLIKPFIKSNGIHMPDYEKKVYKSYNEFFTRKIRRGKRPIDMRPECLISPCDGAALVLPLKDNCVFHVKRSEYTVGRLLRDKKLAKKYEGGTAVILRLAVHDYHRYCYVDDGVLSSYRRIPGVLHTVMPLANDYYEVYHENTREYCTLHSENFGEILVMEVGALCVGRIVNEKNKGIVKRGEEKGRFEFGGSTVILLFEKNTVTWKKELLQNSFEGKETAVKMGEVMGVHQTP